MASEQARQLREQGIQAAKAGQKDAARRLLQQSVRLDPANEAAWLWLVSLAQNQNERIFCLKKVLEINPRNPTALKAAQALGLTTTPQAPAPIQPRPTPQPVQQPRPAPQPAVYEEPETFEDGGIPIPDANVLDELQTQVAGMIEQRRAGTPALPVNWVPKTKRRAGERDVLVLRLQVAAVILIILGLVGAAGVLFVANNPEAQKLLFAPTWTISPTPTSTSTSTPGLTPTPSVTRDTTAEPTFTPSATISLSITPGNPTVRPRATELYLPLPPVRGILNSVELMNEGRYAEALPTLSFEREQTVNSFDPNPYYYEALALSALGRGQEALTLLSDAESRFREVSSDVARSYKPLIDVGVAQVSLQLARESLQAGNRQQAQNFLVTVENRAESALTLDPRFAQAYIILAQRYELEQRWDNALGVLTRGQEVPELATNINLRVEKGRVYFAQGQYDLAAQEAYEALYINPFAEEARLLQIETALAQNEPGLAVIYSERYLFYFPDEPLGFKLLGDARVAEGKPDLALDAYTRALEGDDNDPAYLQALLARANLYRQQNWYTQAQADYTQALSSESDPAIRLQRMEMAYLSGDYEQAQQDITALRNAPDIAQSTLDLTEARIIIDQAGPDNPEALREALALLPTSANLTPNLQPTAEEYRARANYWLGDYTAALSAITGALNGGETGSRHYLRGLILEARSRIEESRTREDDLAAAIRDYEWVLTWGQVYPYNFYEDAVTRFTRLTSPQPEVTPEATAEATAQITPETTTEPGEDPTPTPESL